MSNTTNRNLWNESSATLASWKRHTDEVQQRLELRRLELLAEREAIKVG